MKRFLVPLAAALGIAAAFLPFTRLGEWPGHLFQSWGLTFWGVKGILAGGEIAGVLLVGCFLVLGALGLWALATRLSRAKAVAELAFAAPPAALAAWALAEGAQALSMALYLAAGLLAMLGAVMGIARPDARA
jgi:uncharacterized membrane protein